MNGGFAASAFLVLLLSMVGCLSSPGPDATPVGTAGEPWASGTVERFLGDGTPLPVSDAMGRPSWSLTGHAGAGGEPNIGIARDGSVLVNAWDLTARSLDRGDTWTTVLDFRLEAPVSQVGVTGGGDPMLWVDPVTDRVFVSQLMLYCHTLLWSDDAGEAWTRRDAACPTPVMDHQKVVSGPPPEGPLGSAPLVYPTVVYTCYNKLVATLCAMSYDGGMTWPLETLLPDAATQSCSPINGQPAVGPGGVVVVPKTHQCGGLILVVSQDAGLTWAVRPGPREVGSDTMDPDVAFGQDGALFAAWQGQDHRAYVARSRDLGRTWDGPWLATPPSVKATEFVAVSAGGPGKIALAFLGTADPIEDPATAPPATRWHLYMVASEDAHQDPPAFTAFQVTPDEDPAQVGCTNSFRLPLGDPRREACHNLGDFIDSAVAPDGTFFVSYTDGCTSGCAGRADATQEHSRSTETAVARLNDWRLW